MGEFDVGILVDCVHTDTVCFVQGELLVFLTVLEVGLEYSTNAGLLVW